MYNLTDRVSFLREVALNGKNDDIIFGQRDFYFYKGVLECGENASRLELVTSGIESVLRNVKPIIFEKELLAGYNYPISGDGSREFIIWSCNDDDLRKHFKNSMFNASETEWFINNRWKAEQRLEIPSSPKSKTLYGFHILYETEKDAELIEDIAAYGMCVTDNHSIIGYELLLKIGVEGLLEKIDRYEKQNGSSELYDCCRRVLHAFIDFAERYAAEAEHLAEKEDGERKTELLELARICRSVPRKPANSFREAVQSLCFGHILNTFEDHVNANSLGRLDQILYPYYKKDLESGLTTNESAYEIICCLWVKLYRGYDVQQSCVGGTDINGNSVVNELSYMMLDATEQLDFIRCLSVRFGKNTEKKFMQRALEVVSHVRKGVPFFFNDDVFIPALTNCGGISREDAVGYAHIGCVETTIPGKNNPHGVTARCNLLKALEYTLGNGRSLIRDDLCPGLETGPLENFETYEAFESAVKEQIGHLIRRTCVMTFLTKELGRYSPKPVKSVLTEGCIEKNRDFNCGGAKYDTYELMLIGVPNLADSLMVIKEYVFKRKKYTLVEIKNMLVNNFPDETVRLEFINKVPKYGNNIKEVDSIAADMLNFSCGYIEDMSKELGIIFHAQPFSFLWLFHFGAASAASADGRKRGEILAYSMSPMQGRDCSGFTALIHSLCSLPTRRTPGSISAIVEVDPLLFTDANLPLFADIMLAAAGMGLSNVQFNITDAETLIDAQKHPEKHRNLAVRVSGFSQRFDYLGKEVQDFVIARTKHRTL